MTKITAAILGSCLCALALAACSTKEPEAPAPSSQAGTPAMASSSNTAAGTGAPAAGNSAPSDPKSSGSPAANSGGQPANTASTPTAGAASPSTGMNTTAGSPAGNNMQMPGKPDHNGDIRGLCTIKSNFPDDHACIPAPPPGEGMQIHIGPKNYDDPAEIAKYVMHPGQESSECFTVSTPNDKQIYYQTSMLSGRMGTHHIINTLYASGTVMEGSGKCSDASGGAGGTMSLGSVPGASKPYMPRLSVAPEYAQVGKSIPAHARVQADMHYYNFTDKDILREFWLNIYFVDSAQIKEEAKQIAGLGGFGWNQNPIQPKTDKVYSYNCPVKGEGYIMSLLGHYHAHGKQFVANIVRKSGGTEKVFEMFDYMEPAQFEYNTIVTNPMFNATSAGAVSGRLAVHDGDVVNWTCRIVNDSDVALRYVNEVKTGEMCNLWGASVGVQAISCYLQ